MAVYSIILKFTYIIVLPLLVITSYDINQHGSLESSLTGRILKDAGLLVHVKPYYSWVEKQAITGRKWIEKNAPPLSTVKAKAVEAYKKVRQHSIELFTAAYEIFLNAIKLFGSYIPPGLLQTITKYLSEGLYLILAAYSTMLTYVIYWYELFAKWIENTGIIEKPFMNTVQDFWSSFSMQVQTYSYNISQWVQKKAHCLMS